MSGDRSAGLPERWRLGPSEVVAVVGAGGKSSLLEALARAYEAEGAHVVLTTTTKVRPPGPGGRPLVVAETIEGLVEALAAAAGGGPFSPLVGRRVSSQGKLQGLPSEWIPVLRDLPGVTAVLVEADGSLGRPLKAPAAWEPVLPSGVSLVAGVAGLEAQGVPLDDEHVHRPELLAALLGREVGAILPPASLLDALERGYAEAVPAGACFLAYLNKADLAPPAAALRAAAARAPFEVWAGALGSPGDPRWWPPDAGGSVECLRPADLRPAAVILAAGLARRMGGDKVLAPLGQGTVLGRVVGAALAGGACAEVLVVAGEDAGRVAASLRREVPGGGFRVVRNAEAASGMASSLRVGVGAVARARDIVVLLGDQPFVTAATIGRLLGARALHLRAAAVGLRVDGRVRPPLVLHRSLLPQVLELQGDQGARPLLRRYASAVMGVEAVGREAFDIDEPADLERARQMEERGE